MEYELKSQLQKHLANYLLFQPINYSKVLVFELLENYFDNIESDILEFINRVFSYLITELKGIVSREEISNLKCQQVTENFWNLLYEIRAYLKKNEYVEFSNFLFLDYSYEDSFLTWSEDDKEFTPIKGKSIYFKEIIEEFGLVNVSSILNVFLSIGKYELLPTGLNWFVDVLQTNPSKIIGHGKMEKFIEVLFHDFGVQIKQNKRLLDSYLWLLDNLIKSGSSKAYLIRENFITYKTTG